MKDRGTKGKVSDALSAIGIVDLEDLREFDGNLRAEFDFIKKTYFKSILVNVILSLSLSLSFYLLLSLPFFYSRSSLSSLSLLSLFSLSSLSLSLYLL
jgi:hypothetical protein